MNIKEIINLKELKKYITEGYGEECEEKAMNCPVCTAWWFYYLMEDFVERTTNLEDDD